MHHQEYHHLYDHRWRQARKVWLMENPLCCYCLKAGRTVAADVVDHIIPHKGNVLLFWDQTNWQSLCTMCHDGAKKIEELKGYSAAIDLNGWPVDDAHPVNERENMKRNKV